MAHRPPGAFRMREMEGRAQQPDRDQDQRQSYGDNAKPHIKRQHAVRRRQRDQEKQAIARACRCGEEDN